MMKKNVQVSIASMGFTLEQQAYDLLNDYMSRIEIQYKGDTDSAEIVADIEGRVCELILMKQQSSEVISFDTVSFVVDQLGVPEQSRLQNMGVGIDGENPLVRRLYRDTMHGKIAGVCSGLASYIGIDRTLVRIFFCFPIFISLPYRNIWSINVLDSTIFWAPIVLYVLLWIFVPKALTPRQRLEMKGEKLTANSISRRIKKSMGTDISVKKERFVGRLSRVLYIILKIILWCLRMVGFFVAFVLGAIVLAVVVSFVIMIIIAVAGLGASIGLDAALYGMEGVNMPLLMLGVLLMIAIPILLFVYLLVAVLFERPTKQGLIVLFILLWIVSAAGTAVYVASHWNGISSFRFYKSGNRTEMRIEQHKDMTPDKSETTVI